MKTAQLNNITINQLIKQIKTLKESTGKDWYIKANKGSIKLEESSY